jgi:phage tail-like protein
VDVNGTHVHVLIGSRDWKAPLDASTVAPDERPSLDPLKGQLTLRRELFRFPPRPVEAPFTPEDRRGSARDRFGHFYWISPDRRAVRYRPRDDSSSSIFWSVDELAGEKERPAQTPGAFVACQPPPLPRLPVLSGLAVTGRHFLVVGTLAPAGLLIFDLHGGGPAVWQRWPDRVPFAPFDLAATPDGGLWILDRADGAAEARLWRLDRDLRLVRAGDDVELEPPAADAFRPVDPARPADCVQGNRTFPTGIALNLSSPPVPASGDVLAVVSLPDGTPLVMEVDAAAGDTRLHRWTLTCWTGSPAVTDAETLGPPASLAQALSDLVNEGTALVGHDMAFVAAAPTEPGIISGTVYVGDTAGNQSFAFSLSTGIRGTAESAAIDITALASYFPMRRWAGKALVAGSDAETYYDLADAWLPLTDMPRPRYALRGVLDGIVFDGKDPGCVWHRLFVDACIPPGDSIDVESRAADEKADLAGLPWEREPALRLRPDGLEAPWSGGLCEGSSCPPGTGTWELLFQSAIGRYIELRLTLLGSGRSSPRLRALRAHFPRFSYLSYLPAVYREDQASASFLDRFLANFEGVFTELEGRIESAQALFDYISAPPEALMWLAGWLGAVLDDRWEEWRRRYFLANAAELYRRRGTRRGLLAAVRLSLDACPTAALFADDDGVPFGYRVSEAFRHGDASSAHRFTLLAPIDLAASPVERVRVRDSVAAVVERERPAHAAFDVQLYWALFRVGSARVGHDTALGEGSRLSALVLGAGYVGQSLVGEEHPWNVEDRRVVGRDRTGFPPPLM